MKFSTTKLITVIKTLIYPKFWWVTLQDLFSRKNEIKDIDTHIKESINWLIYGFEKTNNKGIPIAFIPKFGEKWGAPYPETTGYIIPTLIKASEHLNNGNNLLNHAEKMGKWLISLQYSNGSFPGNHGFFTIEDSEPIVFNTGQIIFGLNDCYRITKKEEFIEASNKACEWLLNIQNNDGSWQEFTYKNFAKSYHSRVSWALLDNYLLTKNKNFKIAAKKNLNWVIENINSKGFFEYSSFGKNENAYLHTIAYTIRGLLESSKILEDNKYKKACKPAIQKLFKISEINKVLPGSFNDKWDGNYNYECITGSLQLAIIFMKCFKLEKDIRYLNAAIRINHRIMKTQKINQGLYGIRGGIKGSNPFWGKYMRFRFPNWAVKFFIDSLIMEREILGKLKSKEVL
ncbi:MAG: hypothetical protein ACOCP8_07785 [archaeon]